MIKKVVLIGLILITVLLTYGCKNDPPNEVHSPTDVAGRIIGALSGTASVRLANEMGQLRAFSSGEEIIAHLRAGTIDCAIMEDSAANELVAESSGVKILGEPLAEYDLQFAMAKENAELLQAVNSAIEALKQNGTLSGLHDKYFADKDFTYIPPEGIGNHPGNLTLAAPSDSPPFSYKDADGKFSGLDIEVAKAVCDYLGVELQIVECETLELINAVWYGITDLAVGWFPGEGEELVNSSVAYATAVHVVIVRR